MMTRIALLLLVALALVDGCKDKKPEPTYNGKSLSEWIALSNDRNAPVRESSIIALEAMPKENSATEALARLTSDTDCDVKITAVAAMLGISPQSEASLLSKIGEVLECDDASAANKAFDLVNFQGLWKKPLGKPLRVYAQKPGRTDTQKRVAMEQADKIDKS